MHVRVCVRVGGGASVCRPTVAWSGRALQKPQGRGSGVGSPCRGRQCSDRPRGPGRGCGVSFMGEEPRPGKQAQAREWLSHLRSVRAQHPGEAGGRQDAAWGPFSLRGPRSREGQARLTICTISSSVVWLSPGSSCVSVLGTGRHGEPCGLHPTPPLGQSPMPPALLPLCSALPFVGTPPPADFPMVRP